MSRASRYVALGPATAIPSREMREYVVEDIEFVVVNLDGETTAERVRSDMGRWR